MAFRAGPPLQSLRLTEITNNTGPGPYNLPMADFWECRDNPTVGNIVYNVPNMANYNGRVIYITKTMDTTGTGNNISILLPAGNVFLPSGTDTLTLPDPAFSGILTFNGTTDVGFSFGPQGAVNSVVNDAAGFIDLVENPGSNANIIIKNLKRGTGITLNDDGNSVEIVNSVPAPSTQNTFSVSNNGNNGGVINWDGDGVVSQGIRSNMFNYAPPNEPGHVVTDAHALRVLAGAGGLLVANPGAYDVTAYFRFNTALVTTPYDLQMIMKDPTSTDELAQDFVHVNIGDTEKDLKIIKRVNLAVAGTYPILISKTAGGGVGSTCRLNIQGGSITVVGPIF